MSKALKTIEDLETELQDNLGWRKKEVYSFKLLIEQNNAIEEILLRMGITLLCAHFEGFIRFASNCYIRFVSSQNIAIKQLKDNFAALMIAGEYNSCRKSEKISALQRLVGKCYSLYNSPFHSKNNIISTHSNPSSIELQEILSSIGITTDIFDLKANYIDAHLLNNRHRVVHGERYPISKEDYIQTFNIITELLDQYDEVIIKAADNKEYMRTDS